MQQEEFSWGLKTMHVYQCASRVELSRHGRVELGRVVIVEYSCFGGVDLSRIVMVEWSF